MREPPQPPDCRTPSEVAAYLRDLRAWSGLSLRRLTSELNKRRRAHALPQTTVSTVSYCFDDNRSRLDRDLVVDIARALGLGEAGMSRLWEVCLVAAGRRPISALADVTPSLPSGRAEFTGRDDLAAAAVGAVRSAVANGTPPVVAFHGPAGIGKTELAIHVAHALAAAGHGRDTQVFVELHGFDAQRDPTPDDAVLDRLLKILGLRDSTIWALLDFDRKLDRLRAELRGRDALLVLDNAPGEERLRRLLPALTGCAVLATSRDRIAADGLAASIEVGALDFHAGLSLLSGFDAADRVRREPGVAVRLVNDLCGGRPLDLVALGGQLANPAETGWSLADHAERLAAFPRDEVSRPALAGSCHRLDPLSRRVFRLLALYPGNDFSHYDIAVLADIGLDAAEDALRVLFDRHLLFRREPRRHRMHDVVAAYAQRLLRAEEPLSEQRAALTRLRSAPTLKRHLPPEEWPP